MRKTLLLLCFTLGACAGSSPDSHFFTLSPAPASEPPRPGRPPLRLSAFHLPQLYDRPQMVFRSGPQSVDIDETDRWAEPLDRMAARILGQDLAQRRPQPAGAEIALQIVLDDFIVDRSGVAHLAGNWRAGPKSGAFDWRAQTGGASPDQAAAALSALLGRLASEIDRKS